MKKTGKLQDMEQSLKILKGGIIGRLFLRLNCPSMWFISREKWIKILEFSIYQEVERIKFMEGITNTK